MKVRNALVLGLICVVLAACSNSANPIPVPPASTLPSTADRAPNGRHRLTPAHYRIVDLGAFVQPTRINNHNAVVGYQTPGYGNAIPFLFQHGKLTLLSIYPGDVSATANDINDAGEIVGTSSGGTADHAVVFHPGGVPTLLYQPTPDYPGARANAVNAGGRVVGELEANVPCSPAVVFDGNGLATQLPDIQVANAVNDNGTITGYELFVGAGGCNGESTAYEIDPTHQLPSPSNGANYQGVIPTDINNAGTIIGNYDYCSGSATCDYYGFFDCAMNSVSVCGYAGYVYHGGVVKSIYSPRANAPCIVLNGINQAGEIAGAICTPSNAQRAIRVVGSKVTDLNTLVPANCSWVLQGAADVNDRGVIVGTGLLNGKLHGFMLLPRV